MPNQIDIVGQITGEKADINWVTLIARNFGWTETVTQPQLDENGQPVLDENQQPVMETVDNPENVQDCVGKNIIMYCNQLAINQQKIDDDKEIQDVIDQMRAEKEQARNDMSTKVNIIKN